MQIKELLKGREPPKEKPPPHELSASVNEIINTVGVTKEYGYEYWLGVVSRYAKRHKIEKGKLFPKIYEILEGLQKMNPKYPKGATLTNILKK